MPNYTYFGQPVSEQQVINAAAGFGISVEEYLKRNEGFEIVEDSSLVSDISMPYTPPTGTNTATQKPAKEYDPNAVVKYDPDEHKTGFGKVDQLLGGFLKAIPKYAFDEDVQQQTNEYMRNRLDNVPENLLNAYYSAQIKVKDIFTADLDNLGYNEKQKEIRKEAEVEMMDLYSKLNTLEYKDTGVGMVAGAKEGDAASIIAGVFGAGISMAETVIPAALTFGATLPVQVMAPMYTDYNKAKAKALYGEGKTELTFEEEQAALSRLIQNDETEILTPMALGLVATGMEYVGFKGITNAIKKYPGKGKLLMQLVSTGNKEGFTEVGQLGAEVLNSELGAGKSKLDAAESAWDAMTSDEGLEMWLNGFLGSTQMTVGGKAVNRALRSDKASVKELNKKINDLANLNYTKNSTRNKDVKEALESEIQNAEQDLRDYINEKRKLSEILNEDQKSSLINILNQKDNIKTKVKSLRDQLNNNQISNSEFGYAFRSLNSQDKKLTEQIELINATAKEQLLQTKLETTKEEAEKVGIEQKEFKTKEEYAALFGKKGTKEYEEALDADGHISDDGKTFFINREIASQEGAIGVGSHELLHGIIGKSFSKLDPEIKKRLNKNFLNILSRRDRQAVLNRLANSYGITGDDVLTTEELYTAFSDEIIDGGVKFREGPFGKIANRVEDTLRALSQKGYFDKNFKFLYRKEFGNARQAYNFVKDYSLRIKEGKELSERAKEFAKEDPGRDEVAMSKTAPEKLIKTIKRGRNPKQVKAAEDALVPQYQALALEALGYKEEKGDIRRENVVSAINEYYEAIVRNYNPEKGAFSTHVYNNIAPKNDTIFEKAKTLAIREGVKLDAPEVRELAGDAGATTNVEDTFVQKINILKDFAIADRVANKVKALVKVAEGDTFKQVISKYAGKVGELVFNIPAKKIMEGGANLIPTTKYKDGMPIPAEAQNIQRFFQAGENMSKFIKSLPLYNVADKTADIDKIGENIETPRNVFGVAIGLKGLPLNYFYENFTDPTGEMTSPKGRSKGLTTQTQVKKLKPEFINPTPETIEKAKRDIGITAKNEPNIYNRDIGQLQKGFAKVYSINASLSGGQRFLADKLAKAPVEKKPAIKKQIAGVTAAQSKKAFSKSINKVEKLINMRSRLEIDDATFRDKLLELNGLPPTIRVKKEADIDKFIDNLKTNIFPILPKEAWFGPGKGTAFTSSSKNLGMSSKDPLWSKFQERIQELKEDENIKYGKKINGVKNEDIWSLRNKYTTLFATPEKIRKNIKNGNIEKFNKEVGAIHKALWQRINDAVRKDKKVASGMATYLGFVANDTGHWHKMGAQFAGYSEQLTKRTKGKTKVEYEHAMPATSAYLYLLDAAINKQIDFDTAYEMVIDNYKLIALDKAMDDKLRNARTMKGHSLMKRMPDDWSVIENMWYERYFNPIVAKQDGGIDPKSIIGLDGKTFAETFNINAEGNAAAVKENVAENQKFSKSVNFSRSSNNPAKGITVLDFDDTLATTKSGVRARVPNLDGTPKPNRKVIFLAGGAGSGKSNVVRQLGLEKQGFKVVNQDISLEWLKKNSGLPADMRDLTKEQKSTLGKLQAEARRIAKRKMMKFKGQGGGVVVDGTGGSIKAMTKLVNEFKDKGYDVSMLFVETSLDVALARNKARKERSLLDVIVRKNHEAVQGNKDGFKEMFGNRFMQVNTDNLTMKDPMPTNLVNKMNDFVSGYEKMRLDAEQFASQGADILAQGGEFDFSEFNVVVEGQTAPLFNKALKLQKKFGNKDMFVLTARPAQSAPHIYEFLKANGLNIPLENITGLANSTSEAKALWMANKVGEGYNDFYFADDALQNVQAVQNMLDQFDVKSKVQQAKVKFSKSMNKDFNDILENVTGIESKKRFSAVKARKRGESKGKFRFFIPPSHEDFVGLLYNFIGKGKEGNAHRDFFEKTLIRPLNRAYRELNAAKQSIANDYKSLNKQFTDVKKKLIKKTPDGDFTYQDAIRVYLWDKHGHKIPGLSETDQQELVNLVMNDKELKQYAETLNIISKQDKYIAPTESWEAGDIRIDLDDATGRVGREQFFTEFNENADVVFSQENLNKIEAAYGADVVSAIKDMLYRIGTGRNRPSGQNALVNKFLNYLNGSVASTMFFNIRSAVLQQMSMVNFINFADNNMFAAAKAFSNQEQYWTDWATIFNSDFMKQRRKGIQTDVNGAELAASVKNAKNPIQATIKKLLELGFLPTQIGDNIAIATGGATFLRNRINTYLKEGLSKKEAEAKAFVDFEILAEATQQSARPDMVSQQQASPLGKVILAFQNVTSQFNRLGKKAFLDIKNRRITPGNQTQLQSDMSNLSRIAYYFAIQNLIFYSLQSALFMAMFDDDEDDEKFLKKKERMINGSIDSVLRGSGVWGSAIATLKNMAIKWHEQRDKKYNPDESAVLMEMLNVSPPLGIKARKLVNAEKTLNYNKKVINEMETFDIDNPQWSAVTNYIEATTNVPLNRLYNKTQNVRESLNNQHTALERVLMFSGWSKWNLGIGDSEKIKNIKEKVKGKKKKKKKRRITYF